MNNMNVTSSCNRDREKVTSYGDRDRGNSGSTLSQCQSSSVMYVLAWTTLGQATCFLVVAMFLDDIPILPTDPLTMIGTMYVVMGILFLGTSCLLYKMKQPKVPVCMEVNNAINKSMISDDGNETCSPKESTDHLTGSDIPDINEHQTENDLNSPPVKNEPAPDSRCDPDSQWQMLDCGVHARITSESSNIASARET